VKFTISFMIEAPDAATATKVAVRMAAQAPSFGCTAKGDGVEEVVDLQESQPASYWREVSKEGVAR
jgi:hypothetical protein